MPIRKPFCSDISRMPEDKRRSRSFSSVAGPLALVVVLGPRGRDPLQHQRFELLLVFEHERNGERVGASSELSRLVIAGQSNQIFLRRHQGETVAVSFVA